MSFAWTLKRSPLLIWRLPCGFIIPWPRTSLKGSGNRAIHTGLLCSSHYEARGILAGSLSVWSDRGASNPKVVIEKCSKVITWLLFTLFIYLFFLTDSNDIIFRWARSMSHELVKRCDYFFLLKLILGSPTSGVFVVLCVTLFNDVKKRQISSYILYDYS